ncbi:MAG: hypothetical protein K2L89_08425 [Muribaculaceae bacterium]|nr:hypothetical protein [Muribaculaceae bacterium]
METTLIIWILVALFGAFVVVDYALGIRRKRIHRHTVLSRRHPVEIGNECDELYIPGDINSSHDSDIIEYEEEMI